MILTVWVPEGGRLKVSGRGIKRLSRSVKKAGEVKLRVPLTATGKALLRRHHGKKLKLRVGFTPKSGRNTSADSLALR